MKIKILLHDTKFEKKKGVFYKNYLITKYQRLIVLLAVFYEHLSLNDFYSFSYFKKKGRHYGENE